MFERRIRKGIIVTPRGPKVPNPVSPLSPRDDLVGVPPPPEEPLPSPPSSSSKKLGMFDFLRRIFGSKRDTDGRAVLYKDWRGNGVYVIPRGPRNPNPEPIFLPTPRKSPKDNR